MFLSEKCIGTRTHQPPLIQGLIGRIDAEDEGKIRRPAARTVAALGAWQRQPSHFSPNGADFTAQAELFYPVGPRGNGGLSG